MLFQLLGGPVEHEFMVPWPIGEVLPPYVCSGDTEPFQHYVRIGALPIFAHIGECSTIDHKGCYPHSYFS